MCHFRAAVIALLITNVAFAEDESKRPDPPEGFAWRDMKEVNGAVLVPDGWHFSKTSTKDALAYRVTKENLENNNDSFLTGLTINVAKDVTTKTNVKPSVYAVKIIKDYMEGAATTKKPSVDKVGGMQRITCYVVKKLPRVDDDIMFRVRVTTLANDETGTLYVMIFGAPKDEWEESYRVGKQQFNPIAIDRDV